MENNRELKLMAAAIAAVMQIESGGEIISHSSSRRIGTKWANDHRRMASGNASSINYKNKRSIMR